MISIEKLEGTLKSLNMTLFIWKILSLVMDVFGIDCRLLHEYGHLEAS